MSLLSLLFISASQQAFSNENFPTSLSRTIRLNPWVNLPNTSTWTSVFAAKLDQPDENCTLSELGYNIWQKVMVQHYKNYGKDPTIDDEDSDAANLFFWGKFDGIAVELGGTPKRVRVEDNHLT